MVGDVFPFMIFQPTRPLRGATRLAGLVQHEAVISTHAPLAGRDPAGPAPAVPALYISTHAPLAGRDLPEVTDARFVVVISTHAPLAGRDPAVDDALHIPVISTHAPLAGRDLRGRTAVGGLCHFNPRAPCGARRVRSAPGWCNWYFNPRAPCGARQQKCTNHYAHFCDNRQISDAFAQNAACQGILLLFDAGKPCGFWVRTAQVISARLCFAL